MLLRNKAWSNPQKSATDHMLVLGNITLDRLIVAVKSLTLVGCDELSTWHMSLSVSIKHPSRSQFCFLIMSAPPPRTFLQFPAETLGLIWEAWPPFFPDPEEDFHLLAMSAPGKWQNQESGKMFLPCYFDFLFPVSSVVFLLCHILLKWSTVSFRHSSPLRESKPRFPLSPWVTWSNPVWWNWNLSMYTAVKTPPIHAC